MNERLNALIVAIVCLLMLPVVTFAELPTPTYGWNMGNTLEPPCGEDCWGGPASEALIESVANAGFNAVRIPCAWDSHANQTTHVIDPVYMARVKEVVDWCLARNMQVMINCHWDGGWLDSSGFASFDSTINAKVQSYWTQIANTFAGYDPNLLLFSCTNEPAADTQAETNVLLQYYQTFVTAVRGTGGQNTTRWLVLSGPSTNIDYTDSFMNTFPSDPTPNRLMVEVHDYSPYQYTLMTSDETWGKMFYFWGQGYHHPTMTDRNPTWGEEDYIQGQYLKMKTKFVDNGIPVILGEFHATKRSVLAGWDLDLHLASRTYYHKTQQNLANSNGLKPFYWDTPGGFYNWQTGAILDQANITALTGGDALPPPSVESGLGILREWWTGISGTAVSSLTSDINYPTNPNGRALLTSFEGPTNWANDYGTRIRGYLYPPADGNYTFWIASDDASQLMLSTDDDPCHAVQIAYVATWTDSRVWNKEANQQSSPKPLLAGHKYYIEALQKEGTGGDNIAVAWQGPGIATQQVIGGVYLSPWLYNFKDYATFAPQWLKTNCSRSNAWCSGADRDRDGNVQVDDLAAFADWWLYDSD
jgi:endoglucanase